MKLGIFFDSQVSSGGGYYLACTKLETLIKSVKPDDEIVCFTINKSVTKKLKEEFIQIKVEFFEINLIKKFFLFLFTFNFTKKIFSKIKLLNPLEKILRKEAIDLLFFISPSSFVRFCENINFVYNIWEVQHKSIPYFPEYSDKNYSPSSYDIREESYGLAAKRAFKIVVDSERSAQDIKKHYNCSRENLFEIQAFVPGLPKFFEEKKKDYNFKKIFDDLGLPKKKILFYPAQFWPHKNHIYLIESLKEMEIRGMDNFAMVFTGHDKGNKQYIIDSIKKNNLDKKIVVLEFLKLEEIVALYKNSHALVMPTLVGRSSLPLREAFYFELPVFYTKDILDEKYSYFVNEINLNDFSNLSEYLKNDEFFNKEKLKLAKKFYLETCSDEIIIQSNKKIIQEYEKYSKYWR